MHEIWSPIFTYANPLKNESIIVKPSFISILNLQYFGVIRVYSLVGKSGYVKVMTTTKLNNLETATATVVVATHLSRQ